MTTYAERFAPILSNHLGPNYTVESMGHNLYVITHTGGLTTPVHGPDRPDRRRPVMPSDVTDAAERAARALRGNLPHYTPAARAQGEAFLADLPAAGEG